jgi:hypothetical protein
LYITERWTGIAKLAEDALKQDDCPYIYQARHYITLAIVKDTEKAINLNMARALMRNMDLTRDGSGRPEDVRNLKEDEQWALLHGARSLLRT